jgi:hypothetical protein
MPEYLTDAWAAALSDAAAGDAALPALVGNVSSTVAVDVPDAPAGRVRVIYAFAGRTARVYLAPDEADAVLETDYATVVSMARGDLGPMAAYSKGKVKLSGNPGKVLPVLRAIERVNALNASIGTTF